MNCECLKLNEEKLVEHYAEHGVVNPRVDAEFLGINLATGESTISLVYTIRGENRPYNTQKGKPCHMVASFCPWCGKSVKEAAGTKKGQSLDPNQVQTIAERIKNTTGLQAKESK